MTKNVINIASTELTTARFICKNPKCGMIAEAQVRALDIALRNALQCPFCKAATRRPQSDDAFRRLADALDDIAAIADVVGIEFVLPFPEKSVVVKP